MDSFLIVYTKMHKLVQLCIFNTLDSVQRSNSFQFESRSKAKILFE